jgi:hypothetical protein
MLNTLEDHYIYMATNRGLRVNEALTDTHNPIFNILIKANSNTHNHQHTKLNPFQSLPSLMPLPSSAPPIPGQ